jgi:formylglycine-generating enzyme
VGQMAATGRRRPTARSDPPRVPKMMAWVPDGDFLMGSEDFYPEERPVNRRAEWEYAARGGLDGATYAWGDTATVRGRIMANTWHGRFPSENLRLDGYERTSPVGEFPANGYGLVDVCGNVWEWTTSGYTRDHGPATRSDPQPAGRPCCGPTASARGPKTRLVIKGGSHLCAPNYCLRYLPAARQAQTADTSTSHLGFRCVLQGSSR